MSTRTQNANIQIPRVKLDQILKFQDDLVNYSGELANQIAELEKFSIVHYWTELGDNPNAREMCTIEDFNIMTGEKLSRGQKGNLTKAMTALIMASGITPSYKGSKIRVPFKMLEHFCPIARNLTQAKVIALAKENHTVQSFLTLDDKSQQKLLGVIK